MKPINEPFSIPIFALRISLRQRITNFMLDMIYRANLFVLACLAMGIYLTIIVIQAVSTPGNPFRLAWEGWK